VTFTAAPAFLVLLTIPIGVVAWRALRRRPARFPVAFTNLNLLATVVEPRRSNWRRWVAPTLLGLSLVSVSAALAGPQLRERVTERHAIVIVLVDVSGSMQATDVKPTRLRAAIVSLSAFVRELPSDVEVGLVDFSSEPDVLRTPTLDHGAIEQSISMLQAGGGTALGDGLLTSIMVTLHSLQSAGVTRAGRRFLPADIVLESDGAQDRGTITPLEAASYAAQAGIRVYGISVGTEAGTIEVGTKRSLTPFPVPPDRPLIASVTRLTGGVAFAGTSNKQLKRIYRDLGYTLDRHVQRRDLRADLLLPAALFLLAAVAASKVLAGGII
jgi:Ca-activated chloride channel homolog